MLKKYLIKILIILVATYLITTFYLFLFQRRFIYFPDERDFAQCKSFYRAQQLNINGTRAYWGGEQDKLVVFYHGNAGSACDRSYLQSTFVDAGYSYLFVEYSGYAGDEQKPDQSRLMRDVENVSTWLDELKPGEIVVMGESLGASLAIYHNYLQPVDKLLLVSPFPSLNHVARQHYSVYPTTWLLRDSYQTAKWQRPLATALVIHGALDDIIPLELGQEVFNNLLTNNKNLVIIPGANHNDLTIFPEFYQAINDYLK